MSHTSYELTRVNIFLPKTDKTVKAISKIITRLLRDFGGITCVKPTVVTGYWFDWDKPEKEIVAEVIEDQIIWIIVDVDQRLDDPRLEYFSKLKRKFEKDFEEDEIWIVCHRGWRFI